MVLVVSRLATHQSALILVIKNTLFEKIIKVVSGQDEETTENIAWLYSNVVAAGVYKAPSIKVAEAAKVIENIQRDLNIALVNEFATIFNEMDLDTNAILKAAGTKWNFSPTNRVWLEALHRCGSLLLNA